jgi:hypothetical protein
MVTEQNSKELWDWHDRASSTRRGDSRHQELNTKPQKVRFTLQNTCALNKINISMHGVVCGGDRRASKRNRQTAEMKTRKCGELHKNVMMVHSHLSGPIDSQILTLYSLCHHSWSMIGCSSSQFSKSCFRKADDLDGVKTEPPQWSSSRNAENKRGVCFKWELFG